MGTWWPCTGRSPVLRSIRSSVRVADNFLIVLISEAILTQSGWNPEVIAKGIPQPFLNVQANINPLSKASPKVIT